MEIIPGIHQVDGINANCYLILGDELVLIDTGLPNSSMTILAYLDNVLNHSPSDLKTIILTHCHIDHIGSVYELKALSGAKVAAHEGDADYIAGKKSLPRPQGIKGLFLPGPSTSLKVTPVQPDIILQDNSIVAGLICIHVPGHTPGSVCLYNAERKVLFAGDTLRFSDGKIEGAPAQFTMDMNQAIRSIEKISHIDFDVLLSGHGQPLLTNASILVRKFRRHPL